MDTFHGCYKDGEHDYRHFAALYLAVRFLNLLLFSVLRITNVYCIVATLLVAITLTFVANFQPYKRQTPEHQHCGYSYAAYVNHWVYECSFVVYFRPSLSKVGFWHRAILRCIATSMLIYSLSWCSSHQA